MTTTHPRSRRRHDWGTLLAGLIALTALAAAVLLAISPAPASAETPAERCKRETTAYNNAWKNSWAASHPGKKPSDAPKPPVPYKCGGNNDGPPPTVQPTTTAPEESTKTEVPETTAPSDGPRPALNAPTTRREIEHPGLGQRPIGEAQTGHPKPTRTGTSQRKDLQVPGRILARDWAPSSGLPPFAACGSSDERKEIQDYEVKGGGRAFMRCGNSGYSFEHIKGRHMGDWEAMANMSGDKWMDLMHMSIRETLLNPEVTERQDPKKEGHSATLCYSRRIHLYDKRTGELTGYSFWSNVLVSDRNGDIITAFPSSGAPHCKG
ncbi:hypothetical protein [Gordonia malaquae]|uniref:hypothetical protein n=1 Tax=Gordonia malaquae TaxID=410332 RepID=UPI003016854F